MLFTARGEGVALAAIEALACGVPVIACWDSGAAVDIVPESGPGRLTLPSPRRSPTACWISRPILTVSRWGDWWGNRGARGSRRTTWPNCARDGTGMPSPVKPLRILTITHNYPRFSGDPAGAFVARMAEGAAAQGHEVEVLAPHAMGAPVDEDSAGVRVHRFRYAPEAFERVAYTGSLHGKTLRSPLAALAFPGFLLAFARAVRTAVRRFMPDVVHAHWWLPSGWFASRGSAPYLITCHGSDVRLLDRGPLLRAMALPVFRRAAGITAVSRFLADDIRRLLPALHAEVLVTPMPVDVMSFSERRASRTNPPRILFAGNLVPSKGVDVLLAAGAELQRRGTRSSSEFWVKDR